MPRLRAILFDLDRTLLDRDASVLSFASAQYKAFRPRLDGVEREAFVNAFVRLDARGLVWKDIVYQQLTEECGIRSVTWEELFADFEARIVEYYVPFPNLRSTLEVLSGNYRLGLITNGRAAFQSRTIEKLDIASFFSVILISEAEGVRKPDQEIFRRALDRLDVLPSEAVYVGDHPLTDVKAARDAGMLALWKRNADFHDVPCDGVVDDLSDIPRLMPSLLRITLQNTISP